MRLEGEKRPWGCSRHRKRLHKNSKKEAGNRAAPRHQDLQYLGLAVFSWQTQEETNLTGEADNISFCHQKQTYSDKTGMLWFS